jgi:hypothetical protein
MRNFNSSRPEKGNCMQIKKPVRVFEMRDLVLPIISFPVPCPIRVEIEDDRVRLVLGSRTIEWDKQTGEILESRLDESPSNTDECIKAPNVLLPEK